MDSEINVFNDEDESESGSKSLSSALQDKYSYSNFNCISHIKVSGSPPIDKDSGCLQLPPFVTLNHFNVSHVGDAEEVKKLCSRVRELDLAENSIEDWNEVFYLMELLPRLDFLNLSANPVSCELENIPKNRESGHLKKLVLNNTSIDWGTVYRLMELLPRVDELYLSLNAYSEIPPAENSFDNLTKLHLTDNNITEWNDLKNLAKSFPNLCVLILAGNKISSIDSSDLALLFPKLETLNIGKSQLNCWNELEKLDVFPMLKDLRVHGIPLLERYDEVKRRQLVISRLSKITHLNGSKIHEGERETAERMFIRYYMNEPESNLSPKYHEMVAKHGRLTPLADVDFTPDESVDLVFRFNDKTQCKNVDLHQTVLSLKENLQEFTGLRPSRVRLMYLDVEMMAVRELEEMNVPHKFLYRYSMQDGDEIHIFEIPVVVKRRIRKR